MTDPAEIARMDDETLDRMLALADAIRSQLRQHGKPDVLPLHLAEEEAWCRMLKAVRVAAELTKGEG